MKAYIFEKRQLKLREDEITLNSQNYQPSNKQKSVGTSVTPSNTNTSPNLNRDLSNAVAQKPTSSSYDVNLSTYSNKNTATKPVVANINAINTSDATQTIQQAMQNDPTLRTAVNNGNAIAKVHLQNGSTTATSQTNESINFTKKELDNFLRNL